MRTNRLEVPLCSGGDLANSLEVLVGAPVGRQGGEGNVDNLGGGHFENEADDQIRASKEEGEIRGKRMDKM
jgi:hypothetical protein